MTDRTLPMVMVNHVAVDIAASPDAIWRIILDHYVEGNSFRRMAAVEPFRSVDAGHDGYRIRIDQDGTVDERIVRVTERDEDHRRVSLAVEYVSVPSMRVYATYYAQHANDGARYAIDCHTTFEIPVPADGTGADAASILKDYKSDADLHLLEYLDQIKGSFEAV